jgi:hypothetical protein
MYEAARKTATYTVKTFWDANGQYWDAGERP